MVTSVALSPAEINKLIWYYSIELEDGLVTKGSDFVNIIPTKKLLRTVNLNGARVLDIGVMEGALSILMEREGAQVVAYDRLDWSDKVDLVQDVHQSNLDYRCGQPFFDFAKETQSGGEIFDVVVMSGVLYHVIDPLLFLHFARCLMSPGTVFIIETSCVTDEEAVLNFNNQGRFYASTNYYQVSTSWLDYCLRYLGFRILDFAYVNPNVSNYYGLHIPRVALKCVLTDNMVVSQDDVWARKGLVFRDLNEFMVYEQKPSLNANQRIDTNCQEGLPLHRECNSINVTSCIKNSPPLPTNDVSFVLRQDSRL